MKQLRSRSADYILYKSYKMVTRLSHINQLDPRNILPDSVLQILPFRAITLKFESLSKKLAKIKMILFVNYLDKEQKNGR